MRPKIGKQSYLPLWHFVVDRLPQSSGFWNENVESSQCQVDKNFCRSSSAIDVSLGKDNLQNGVELEILEFMDHQSTGNIRN